MKQVCVSLSNLLLDPKFANRLSNMYDLPDLMRSVFNKYILNDFFNLEQIVQEKKIDEFKSVTGLVAELVWLTNNIVTEELNGVGQIP